MYNERGQILQAQFYPIQNSTPNAIHPELSIHSCDNRFQPQVQSLPRHQILQRRGTSQQPQQQVVVTLPPHLEGTDSSSRQQSDYSSDSSLSNNIRIKRKFTKGNYRNEHTSTTMSKHSSNANVNSRKQPQPLPARPGQNHITRMSETEYDGCTSDSQREDMIKAPQHMFRNQVDGDDAKEDTELKLINIDCAKHQRQCQYQDRTIIDTLMHYLSCTAANGRLVVINLSRRGLVWTDAHAVREAMLRNPLLSVLKLSYNDLGDRGAAIVASGFSAVSNNSPNTTTSNKHPSLTTLDLGFNSIGDVGCATLALHAVVGNPTLSTLYLSGNQFQQTGVMAIAGAILHGCNLTNLYLDYTSIGQVGVQALARAIAERDALVDRLGDVELKAIQKLHLVDIRMGYDGFVTLSSMLLTNYSIQTLCLSNNGVDDSCMALLAQSLSRNKRLPLEVIQLSFNEISDVGVECLMNAVWGSQTLKELRLDNNLMRDRGAQLAAVVLTSIKLQVLDLSFNKITSVGIKALMKSLSENDSLQYLGLSGIDIDPNASKALAYGLAYNSTLRYLHIDTCQIGYAAQRHIIAGVVSNRLASLRVLTGFPVGTICPTLGLPKPLEEYTNDQCLKFIRLMWKQWRDDTGFSNNPREVQVMEVRRMGPAPPPDVVRASKMAFQVLGLHGVAALQAEDHEKDLSETSPLVRSTDIMLERCISGSLRVPPFPEDSVMNGLEMLNEAQSKPDGLNTPSDRPRVEKVRRERNLAWLRANFHSIHQVGQLPFNEADMWQLHQYFYSPLVTHTDCENENSSATTVPSMITSATTSVDESFNASTMSPSSMLSRNGLQRTQIGRVLSFQTLGDASRSVLSVGSVSINSSVTRRRTLQKMEEKEEDESSVCSEDAQPITKRARNFKPRIAYYPRIRVLLETMGAKQSQHQILPLLRQLKFVEGVLFEGRNVYGNEIHATDDATPADVEMILLDLM